MTPACPCGLSPAETTAIGAVAIGLLVAGIWIGLRAVRDRLRKRRQSRPERAPTGSAAE